MQRDDIPLDEERLRRIGAKDLRATACNSTCFRENRMACVV
jgi:hypothetical protein